MANASARIETWRQGWRFDESAGMYVFGGYVEDASPKRNSVIVDDELDDTRLANVPLSTGVINLRLHNAGKGKPILQGGDTDDELDDIEEGQSQSIWPYVMGRYD